MTQNNYDDLAVCNLGLNILGVPAISSFDEEDDLPALCAALYPIVRDAVLSSHPYLASNAERQLAVDADIDPGGQFERAFKLPSDLLAGPFNVLGDGSSVNDGAWNIFGDHLHASYETVIITYRARPATETLPSPIILQIANEFAAQGAIPITENSQRSDVLAGKAEMLGIKARNVNAQSSPMRSLFKNGDPITRTRY